MAAQDAAMFRFDRCPPLATAALSARSAAVALAAQAFDAAGAPDAAAAAAGRVLLQLTPGQDFRTHDGRPEGLPAWRINTDIAQRVMLAFQAAGQPLVIDYEHQTLHTADNGQPAPAAGWMHKLVWIAGRGLFAEAELTERARQLVAAGEYRYFSPVIEYHPGTGELVRILMGALTNNPAIQGMQAVSLLAAARARFLTPTTPTIPTTDDLKESQAVDLLKKLIDALGLPAGSDDAAVLAACSAHQAQAQAALAALELDASADAQAVTAALAARTASQPPQQPDPAQFVPVATVQTLQAQVASLSAQAHQRQVQDVLAPALTDGRLLPAEKDWAETLAKTPEGLASLSQLLAVRQPVAALAGTQTGGVPPQGSAQPEAGLSAAELAVAAACGIAPKDFAQAKE